MITESPLLDFMTVEAYIDDAWTPLTEDVQTVSITRGGQRRGPVSTVEIGTLHCTLVNRTDLIDSDALKPNVPVRVQHHIAGEYDVHEAQEVYSHGFEDYAEGLIPAELVYSEGFEGHDYSYAGGWVNPSGPYNFSGGGGGHTGDRYYQPEFTNGSNRYVSHTFATEPGRSYTFAGWVTAWGPGELEDVRAKAQTSDVTGATVTSIPDYLDGYVQFSVTFTATSTTEEIRLYCTSTGGGGWDDFTLTRDAYTEVIDDGLDGQWMGGTVTDDMPHTGTYSLARVNEGSSGQFTLNSGLEVEDGLPYTVTLWARVASGTATATLSGNPLTSPATSLSTSWTQLSYSFTASGTTEPLYISWAGAGTYYFDDITVTRDAYSVTITEPVATPIYTGRINDINTVTLLNKTTGVETDHVNLVAVDGIAALSNTTRYGAVTDGGAGYETWAHRIIRLADSAPAGVDVQAPADDSPIVRYQL